MGLRVSFAALALILSVNTHTSASAAPLSPSGSWQVDYAENECQLVREFGTGEAKTWLRISRAASLDKLDIMIGGTSLPASNRNVEMTISALPGTESAKVSATPYAAEIDGKAHNIYRSFAMDQAFLHTLTDTQMLGFKSKANVDVTLQTKGIKKALGALSTCHDNLLTTVFKLDLPQLRSLQSLPQPGKNVASWVTTDDYPRDALVKKWTGRVQFVITVDNKGKPSNCNIVISSGHTSLDQTACQLMMRRGSFTPAIDANGNPVAAQWPSAVFWQIPR